MASKNNWLTWTAHSLLLTWSAWACGQTQTLPSPLKISVEGTAFRVDYSDGSTLTKDQLTGKEIVVGQAGQQVRLRIDSVEEDARSPGVWLHEISVQDGLGKWDNICLPDAEGKRKSFPILGRLEATGKFVYDPARMTLTCTSGAQGKCVRAGYHYWTTDKSGHPLMDHFKSCIRMVRADYCGDGQGWTENGTLIDIYDDLKIQERSVETDIAFEAAWGPEGAECVNHTRVPRNLSIDQLKNSCPRLASAPMGAACTESSARLMPNVFLFNGSRAQSP